MIKASHNESEAGNTLLDNDHIMTPKVVFSLLVVLIVGAWGCKSSQPQAVPASSFANKGVAEQKKPQPASQPVQQSTVAPSPSPPQAAAADDQGWSVYESKQGGFTISYPRTASLETPKPGKTEFTFIQPFATGRDVLTFDVIVADNPKGLSAEDWGLQQWVDADNLIKEQEETQLAGQKAYRLTVSGGDEADIHIYTVSGKKVYELDYTYAQTLSEQSPEVRQQLANTFRVMAESFALTTTPPPAAPALDGGWSVYENVPEGFKISYPKAASLTTPERGKVVFTIVQPFAMGRAVMIFEVMVRDNPHSRSAKDWALEEWADAGYLIKVREETQLAGRPAYRLTTFEGDGGGFHIFTASGKKVYELYYSDAQSRDELSREARQQVTDTFNKMVESFTLINQP